MTPNQIKRLRARQGWTQLQLSTELGVTIDAVKSWECGRRKMSAPAEKLLRVITNEVK